jgi:poly(hydroxyalkanoate) granule-associated protein
MARKPKSSNVLDAVQQVWLAGMGAISRAQQEGPKAFQDAVSEGLKLLDKSRENAEQLLRELLGSAQGSVMTRVDGVREQANETLDNIEALLQNRVQKAMQQMGVPNADEVRLLNRRIAELNETVAALSRRTARPARAKKKAPARKKAKAAKTVARRPRARRKTG